MTYHIKQGDVLEVTRGYPDNYFDGLFCDPPYGLSFMGKGWDTFASEKIKATKVKRKLAYKYDYNTGQYRESWTTKDTGATTAGTYDHSRNGHLNFQEFMTEWAKEALRVLKPGAFGLVFGGTRTWHRLACALEDAGFELRDTLIWLYGSGFPKSFDISKGIDKAAGAEREVVGKREDIHPHGKNCRKQEINYPIGDYIPITVPATNPAKRWQGYGTALKPSWEPVLLIRKPLDGNNVQNALKHGCGGLNIDGGRIGTGDNLGGGQYSGKTRTEGNCYGKHHNLTPEQYPNPQGRWPANLILDEASLYKVPDYFVCPYCGHKFTDYCKPPSIPGTLVKECGIEIKCPECGEKAEHEFEAVRDPNCSAAMLDAQSGERPSGGRKAGQTWRTCGKITGEAKEGSRVYRDYITDSGGASRYFKVVDRFRYCAKASPAERNAGLEGFEEKQCPFGSSNESGKMFDDGTNPIYRRNHHPTVKPLDLCRYLAKLILPPEREGDPRKLNVPFCGSGSEIIGALQAGWDEVEGVEIDPDYCKIAEARLTYWCKREREKIPF